MTCDPFPSRCDDCGAGLLDFADRCPPGQCRPRRRWRRYRTALGFWGLGVSRGPGGWVIQVGPWCFTTEPRD